MPQYSPLMYSTQYRLRCVTVVSSSAHSSCMSSLRNTVEE